MVLGGAGRRLVGPTSPLGCPLGELGTNRCDVSDAALACTGVESEPNRHLGCRHEGQLLGSVVFGHGSNCDEGVYQPVGTQVSGSM